MVDNLKQFCRGLGIKVVNLAEAPTKTDSTGMGCGCATMSRNDPPHLVALVDLLRQGKTMSYNEVKAGDVVNEFTGIRNRLPHQDQQWVIANAKKCGIPIRRKRRSVVLRLVHLSANSSKFVFPTKVGIHS